MAKTTLSDFGFGETSPEQRFGLSSTARKAPERPPVLQSPLASDAMRQGVAYGLKAPGTATISRSAPEGEVSIGQIEQADPQRMPLAAERFGPGSKTGQISDAPTVETGEPEAEDILDRMLMRSRELLDHSFAGFDNMRSSLKTNAAINQIEAAQNPVDETSIGSAYGSQAQPALQQRTAEIDPAVENAHYERAAQLVADADKLAKRAGTVKMSEAAQRFIEADSFSEGWQAFIDDPVASILEVTAQSAAPSLAALAGGAVGGLAAGPVGFAAGMGAGSARIEYASGIMEGLRDNGVDVTDPKSLRKAVEDKDLMAKVRLDAGRGAASVGLFDAAAGAIAPLKLAPAAMGVVSREITNLFAQTASQGALGGAGEAGKQLANEGRITQPGAVMAEVAGEAGFAPVETLTAAKTARNDAGAESGLRKAFTGEDLTDGEAKALGRSGYVTIDNDEIVLSKAGQKKAGELYRKDAPGKSRTVALASNADPENDAADNALQKLKRREELTPEDVSALKIAGYAQDNTGNMPQDIEITPQGAARFRGMADPEQPGAAPTPEPTPNETETTDDQAASTGQGPRLGIPEPDAGRSPQAQAPEQREAGRRAGPDSGRRPAEAAQQPLDDAPEGAFDPTAASQASLARGLSNTAPQPWQQPRSAFYRDPDNAGVDHEDAVRAALEQGENVSPDVLIDYPDLADSAQESTNQARTAQKQGDKSEKVGRKNSAQPESGSKTASVPVMITRQMRDQLRDIGYSDAQIRQMKPQAAWDAIQSLQSKPDQGPQPLADQGAQNAEVLPQAVESKPDQETPTPVPKNGNPLAPKSITRGMREDLNDLGYEKADIERMGPDIAAEVIAGQRRKPGAAVTRADKARQRIEKMRRIDNQNDDLVTAVRKLGGINTDIESDWRGRLSHLNKRDRTPGLPGIEQTGDKGLALDALTERLAEEGYVGTPGDAYDQSELAELLSRAESGERVYGNAPAADALEQAAQERAASEADYESAVIDELPDTVEQETGRPTPPPPESDLEPIGSGTAFDQDAYQPDWDPDTRALGEWFEEASRFDPDRAEDILSSGANDATVARRLSEVVTDGRRQQREEEPAVSQRQGARESDPGSDGGPAAAEAPQAPDPALGPSLSRADRARQAIGADVGDIVTPSADVGYSAAGTPYRIDSINNGGEVWVTNTRTGGSTNWSRADLQRARSQGATFDRTPDPQAEATDEPGPEPGFSLQGQTQDAGPAPDRAPRADLFGDDTRDAQAIADETRRRDDRRSPDADVPADADGGLFARQTRDIEDANRLDTTADLDSSPGNTVFGRYAALGSEPIEMWQAADDLSGLIGFDSPFEIVTVADMPAGVPARFNLSDGRIEVAAGPVPRAQAAQYLVEEVLHGVDAVSTDRTLSAGATMLNPQTGRIGQQARRAYANDTALTSFMAYPMNPAHGLSRTQVQAELFARLGVVYFGDPQLLQANAPAAYEVFHGIFQLDTRIGPGGGDAVFGRVWTAAGRRRPGRGQSGPARASDSRDGGVGAPGARSAGGRGLDELRDAAAEVLHANRRGSRVQFGRLGSSERNGSLTSDQAARGTGDPGLSPTESIGDRIAAARQTGSGGANAGGLPQGSVDDPRAARAYHGTPHQFDRFSLDAIGTGEGVQAYGWGLYFASRRQVANYYREALSGMPAVKNALQAAGIDNPELAAFIAEDIRQKNGDMLAVADAVEALADPDEATEQSGHIRQAATAIRNDPDSFKGDNGHLYQVDIPEANELLDWDAPLSQQPEAVADKLQKAIDTLIPLRKQEQMRRMPQMRSRHDEYVRNPDRVLGRTLYYDLADELGDYKAASQYLDSLGIPGLRYLDNASRGGSGESRNYVIWAEDTVTVEAVNDELRQAEIMAARGGSSPDPAAPASSTATDQETADVETLKDTLSRYFEREDIDIRVATDVPADSASTARELAPLFGKRVVFFETDDPQVATFNGLALPNEDVVYLNASAEVAHTALLGHELAHYLKRDAPDLWSQLEQTAAEEIQNAPEYRDWLNGLMAREGYTASDDLVREEMIADFIGDQFLKPSFWNRVMERSEPSVAQRIAGMLRRFLDNVLQWLNQRGFGSTRYFQDIARMREAAAAAFSQYASSGRRGSGEQTQAAASRDRAAPGSRASRVRDTAEGAADTQDTAPPKSLKRRDRQQRTQARYNAEQTIPPNRRRDARLIGRDADGRTVAAARVVDGQWQVLTQTPDLLSYQQSTYASREAAEDALRADGLDVSLEVPGAPGGRQGAFEDNDLAMPERGYFGEVGRYLQYKAQDKFNTLKRLQETAERQRDERLAEQGDPYLQETLYHGRTRQAMDAFDETQVDPLLDALQKTEFRLNSLTEYVPGLDAALGERFGHLSAVDAYLYARHAPEANAQLEQINPGESAMSGMSNAEAEAIMAALEGRGEGQALADIAERVDRMTQSTRDLLVSSGLEKQSTIDAWEEAYSRYVPLQGEPGGPGQDAAQRMPGAGRGFDTRGNAAQRRLGRRSPAQNLLANVVSGHYASIRRAEKNRVGRAMLRFAQENPSTLWDIDQPMTKRGLDPVTGLVTNQADPSQRQRDNVFIVRVDGVEHHIAFDESNPHAMRLASSLKNLGATDMGLFVKSLHWVNGKLSMLSTSLNPEFVVSNFARDLQTAFVNLNDSDAQALKGRIMRDAASGKAYRAIRRYQKEQRDSEWAQYYGEFLADGASTGWMEGYDSIDQFAATLSKRLDREKPGTWPFIRRQGHNLFEFIGHANTAVENSIRLSAYIHARENGLARQRAAQMAKELTVNFNRKGEAGNALNAFYLFYNAAVQGSARIIQAGARSPKARRYMMAAVAAGVALDIANRWLAGDDDDGENRYDRIPDYIKQMNWIFMLPANEGMPDWVPDWARGPEGDYIKFPLPYGYNVLNYAGQKVGRAFSAATGEIRDYNPAAEAAGLALAGLDAFNPIGASPSFAQFVSPTITDPIVQWSENQNFAGIPIRPDGNPFGPPPPAYTQHYSGVRPWSLWVTKQLNMASGGSTVRPGAVDVNPELLDHLWDFATGGVGRFVAETASLPSKVHDAINDKADINAYQVPFVGKLYGTPRTSASRDLYYDRSDKMRMLEQEYELAKKDGDRAHRQSLSRRFPGETDMLPVYDRISSQVRRLGRRANEIEGSNLSESEKQSRIKRIDERREKLYEEFNRTYRRRVLGDQS